MLSVELKTQPKLSSVNTCSPSATRGREAVVPDVVAGFVTVPTDCPSL